jgi:nitrite reductase (NO-forming)
VLGTFFLAGLLSMAAAAVAALVHALGGPYWLHWVALHLLFLGGISQLVIGAGQFFVCAFLATDPPPRRLVHAQLATWNAGTALVAVGVPTAEPHLVEAGAALIGAGLVLYAVALLGMERRSLQHAPWALRWYQASAGCLAVGALLGALMARGTLWVHGSLLGAHLALNLGGWFGLAIVGTLHTLFPSLTQTRLRHPRLQPPTFWLWLGGIVALATGAAFAQAAVLVAGWALLLAAASLLCFNLLACLHAGVRPLPLSVRLLSIAQAFLPAGLTVALVSTLTDGAYGPFVGAPRAALAALLAAGWIGLTVAGALLHLLAILGRIRRFTLPMPRPRPVRDRALTLAAGLGVATLALSHARGLAPLSLPGTVLTLGSAATLALAVLTLAWRAAGPQRR